MKFNLPHPIFTEAMRKVASREVRRQKLYVRTPSKAHLKQLAEVSKAIKKHGLPKNFVRRKLPDGLGYGIFLHPEAEPILRGQVIAPYSGKVLFVSNDAPDDSAYAFEILSGMRLTKEEQAQFDPNKTYQAKRRYALQIDALKAGNFTRYINHSEEPNIVASFFKIPSNSYGMDLVPVEIVYLANKKILPGEQLLVCYEGEDKSYWSALEIQPVAIVPQTFRLNASLKVYH